MSSFLFVLDYKLLRVITTCGDHKLCNGNFICLMNKKGKLSINVISVQFSHSVVSDSL